MGLRGAFKNVKLLLQLRKGGKEWEKEMAKFDGKKNLKKGGWRLLQAAGVAAGTGVALLFMDADKITAILSSAGIGDVLVASLVPLFAAGGEMLRNFFKHGGAA